MAIAKAELKFHIRPARPEEAAKLSALALASKAHWGYEPDFLEACRAELSLSVEYILNSPVFVLEKETQILGFYGLREIDGAVELAYLFINPSVINRGYGKRLWNHAVETATRLGHQRLLIESDPYAEKFYETMGARRIGEAASSANQDRRLPLMEFQLS